MDTAAHTETVRRAYRIAIRDLRACYNPEGIVAGRLHFNAYWARDGFWAMFGALALADYEQAELHLDTFIANQRPSGELPVRVEFLGHTLGHYHTRRVMPKALFRVGSLFTEPIDPTALYIMAAGEYFDHTHDMAFCERFEQAADRGIQWLARRDRDGDGIVENNFLGGWMDSILKKDKVFYINVTYYLALRAAERMKRGLGKRADAERMRAGADRLHAQFQDRFWSGRYFSDWLRGDRRGGFASDGNVLAILFGIATDAQAREILGFIAEHGLDADAPLATCHPVYTLRQVYPLYFAAGIPDYHRTMIWPWLGTLNAVNKHRLGSPTDAVADLARIGEWYIRRGAVGETYDRQGNPISRRFYHSEVPFAWHAGLYVYAVHAIGAAPGASTDPIPSAAAAERPTGPREGTPVPVL